MEEQKIVSEYYSIREKSKLKNCMTAFKMAYENLADAMSTEHIDVNDFICDDYPFSQSFDELNISQWVDETIEQIDKSNEIKFIL